jgi:ubiquinone/menaquinone biosynthesis C-methylase UbiE
MTYLLGHDATEQDRLFHQHVLWRGTLLPTLQEVGVRRGAAVLEVGCGTGVLLADIAELVLPDGVAAGIERSADAVARRAIFSVTARR